jgi:hypothetical protein
MTKDDLVVIEVMPRHLRASHEAAGNSGVYPHNGAERFRVEVGAGREYAESDPEWTQFVLAPSPERYDVVDVEKLYQL